MAGRGLSRPTLSVTESAAGSCRWRVNWRPRQIIQVGISFSAVVPVSLTCLTPLAAMSVRPHFSPAQPAAKLEQANGCSGVAFRFQCGHVLHRLCHGRNLVPIPRAAPGAFGRFGSVCQPQTPARADAALRQRLDRPAGTAFRLVYLPL